MESSQLKRCVAVRMGEPKCFKLFPSPLNTAPGMELQLCNPPLIFGSSKLFVEQTVTAAPQSYAAAAIGAAPAFKEKRAVPAVIGVLTVADTVTTMTVDGIVYEFGLIHPVKIRAVSAVHVENRVPAVLIKVATEYEVAVLVREGVMTVVAIFALRVNQRKSGRRVTQLQELREEGSVKVEFAAGGFRVPPLAPPRLWRINRKRAPRRVDRNYWRPRQCTAPAVETTFVSISQPPLLPAVNAEPRRRHPQLGGDRQIKRPKLKSRSATGAILLHGNVVALFLPLLHPP